MEELEELLNDIKMYLEVGRNSPLLEFWQAMLVLCQDAIERAKGATKAPGLHQSVSNDIRTILDGKSVKQLQILQDSIVHKLASGEPVDVEYWESLLRALMVYKARVRQCCPRSWALARRRRGGGGGGGGGGGRGERRAAGRTCQL